MGGERNIEVLLARHKSSISALKEKLGEELDPSWQDDIWLLRFVLSATAEPAGQVDLAKAESNIRATLAWRKEKATLLQVSRCMLAWPHARPLHLPCASSSHAWAVPAQAAKDGSPPPHNDTFKKFMAMDYHGQTKEGDVLVIVRAGISNTRALMEQNNHLTTDDIVDNMMYKRELVSSWGMGDGKRPGRRLPAQLRVLCGFQATKRAGHMATSDGCSLPLPLFDPV